MPEAQPTVSVIMAAYNAEAHLRAAVDSILGQTLGDFELIVVDDGSTDSTADMLSRYAQRDSRITALTQPNAGLAAARNAAVARSRGEFAAIMDSDDIAQPRRLQMQRDFLLENPDCAAVSCRCELMSAHGNPLKTQRPRPPLQPPGAPLEKLLGQPTRVNQTAMLRMKALGRGALYRPWFRVLEDFDFSLRVAERHQTGHINDPPLYRYRQYPTRGANLMSQNPVMFWHYWCAAALSAHCRRSGRDDIINALSAPDSVPQSLLPAIAELPHPTKATCIKNARHWCRRSLRQGASNGVEQIMEGLFRIATDHRDVSAIRKTLLSVFFYALRAGQWKILAHIARQSCALSKTMRTTQ